MRSMFVRVLMLTGYASVRHVEVSLPFVEAILDGERSYVERRRLEGTELRRARAPLLRFLVRLALKCDNAEELGKRLRRRYQRQQQRQTWSGLVAPRPTPRSSGYSRTSLIASGRHCLNCIDKLRY